MPRPLRRSVKRARDLKNASLRHIANLSLSLSLPLPLHRALRERQIRARVVLYKQRIVSLAGSDRFLRYARARGGLRKLHREYDAWQELRRQGLGDILVPYMRLDRLADGALILEMPLLKQVTREDELAALLPILQGISNRAALVSHPSFPSTVAAGLEVVSRVCPAGVPNSFVSSALLAAAFDRPVRTGISHRDLHRRNIMRGSDGRPVLIDLKSCAADQVLALDILIFVCKYMASRNRLSIMDNAYALQRRGWNVPELAAVLSFIDLPRPIWGPVLALHALGQAASKKGGGNRMHPALGLLLRRFVARDWTLGSPADTPIVAPDHPAPNLDSV